MNSLLLAAIVVALAGVALTLQAPLNAALGRSIGSGLAAATVSFGVGFVALLSVSLALGQAGALGRVAAAPPVLLIGGMFGGFYVWAMLWAIPTLGALTTITVLILGQMTAALVIDATGFQGLPAAAVTPARIVAAALVAAGVVLSRF